jgi:hypothetical protein
MLSSSNKETLTRVFSDAHVLDVDLSRWDKSISIWLLSDHYKEWQDRCPLVVVDFLGVIDFHIRFNHEDVHLPDTQHVQWNIYKSSILEKDNQISVDLSGHHSSPCVGVVCSGITIREASHAVLDNLQPDWNEPFSPLVRRSIEELSRRLRRRH